MSRAIFMLFALVACAAGRQLQQSAPGLAAGAAAPPAGAAKQPIAFSNWTAALEAIANMPATNDSLTTLAAAIQSAGVLGAVNSTTAWTILAPTNEAFAERLAEDLDMNITTLLDPANNATLLKVLSYHVIPARAVTSSMLTNGMNLTTALEGAEPLSIKLESGKKPRFVGDTNNAAVDVADVRVGASVIHVVNDLLLPEGIGKGKGKIGDDN